MPPAERFDILVLGSNKGGKLLAWRLARSGMSVAVVERPWVGGSCPAVACLPRKSEIWSALAAHLARNTGSFGTATGAVHTVMAAIQTAILAGLPYQTLRDAVRMAAKLCLPAAPGKNDQIDRSPSVAHFSGLAWARAIRLMRWPVHEGMSRPRASNLRKVSIGA
jgi:choline dehydrogenase-like flavoprotein